MYGGPLGDIIGAPYEFDNGEKTKIFELFAASSSYTDDTLMSIAVCEALMNAKGKSDAEVRKAVIHSLRKWAKKPKYSHIFEEYGLKFGKWLESKHPVPYGSFGNGSAMRVGAAGWLFDSLEETLKYAKLTAEVTHNHPEGVKGAQAVAAVIFLARNGVPKESIKHYIETTFEYDLSRTLAQIRPTYSHKESCQECVPQAITCFLEAENYEDAIRNAISIGGDTDTIGCITGSMAEAFWGVPQTLKNKCREYLEDDMLAVITRFQKQKLGFQELTKNDFHSLADIPSPLDDLEQMKTSGDVSYQKFISDAEYYQDSQNTSEQGKRFAKLAIPAVKTGYPLEDLEAFWTVRSILDKKLNDSSFTEEQRFAISAAKEYCEKTWEELLNNANKGQKAAPLTKKDRIARMKALKEALVNYTKAINNDKDPISQSVDEIAIASLDERMKTGMTPAQNARMAESVRELYDLVDSVDPPKMPSSSAFQNMKSSLKQFAELAESTNFQNQKEMATYRKSQQQAIKMVKAYITYKQEENGTWHKRSNIEYQRVALAEAILDNLQKKDSSNTLFSDNKAPSDEKLHQLICAAKKNLVLGKNVEQAASVLYAVKRLPTKQIPVTYDNVVQYAEDYKNRPLFCNVVKQITAKDMVDSIQNGAFDTKYARVQAKYNWDIVCAKRKREQLLEQQKQTLQRQTQTIQQYPQQIQTVQQQVENNLQKLQQQLQKLQQQPRQQQIQQQKKSLQQRIQKQQKSLQQLRQKQQKLLQEQHKIQTQQTIQIQQQQNLPPKQKIQAQKQQIQEQKQLIKKYDTLLLEHMQLMQEQQQPQEPQKQQGQQKSQKKRVKKMMIGKSV